MDSSLTLSNLISLLFRGTNTLPSNLDPDEWSHLVKFRPLIALDLTGVNSRIFGKAISDFVVTFLRDLPTPEIRSPVSDPGQDTMQSLDASIENLFSHGGEDGADTSGFSAFSNPGSSGFSLSSFVSGEGHARDKTLEEIEEDIRVKNEKESVLFPYLQRLSLRSCKLLPGHDLSILLPRFTNLTHLDLSYTRIDGEALAQLKEMPLRAISLSRCSKLEGHDLLS